ncbi:MAG: glycosyltransferase family 2 protein [Candidatus Woesearchaeota archaeon]
MPQVSIILPCLNEQASIGNCIRTIKKVISENNLDAEIIAVDNASTDSSAKIIKSYDVKYVFEPKRGYGSAYLAGFKHAKGKYIIMADPDSTYDFNEIPKFLNKLENGYDFVIGNRFRGNIEKGSMSITHKYIGNPALSFLFKTFFRSRLGDIHCGFRAIKRTSLEKLSLNTLGMEFASEMVIKAKQNNLKIMEIPINYYKRVGKSKIHTFSDGWRHLRFMLIYAPTYLFLIPGILFLLLGTGLLILFMVGPVSFIGISFYNRPAILGSFLIILGYQIILLDIYTKTYMKSIKMIKTNRFIDFLAGCISFESGIIIGVIITFIGIILGIFEMSDWIIRGFPPLTSNTMLLVFTLAIIGIQTIFSVFFLSILLVEKK